MVSLEPFSAVSNASEEPRPGLACSKTALQVLEVVDCVADSPALNLVAQLCWLTNAAQFLLAARRDNKVSKTPRWPRSWADLSLLQLYSHRDARANFASAGLA